jgi:hypothetical protein
MTPIASALFDANSIPQDLVTGVIVTLLGLLILFSFKPRLSIEPRGSREEPSFLIANKGLMQVIEIRAKLFNIDRSKTPAKREPLELVVSELFQLPGKMSREKHRPGDLGKKSEFWFGIKTESLDQIDLTGNNYLLFQVVGRHGFTNFTRLAKRRIYSEDLCEQKELTAEDRIDLKPDGQVRDPVDEA